MAASDLLTQRVCAFVAHHTGHALEKISPETRLAWDIGLGGDDAVDLFVAFAAEFDVDRESFSKLDFRKQFGDEGSWLFLFFPLLLLALPFFWYDEWLHRHDKQWIRLKDLVAAAEQKKWLKQ